jgi:tripartite-type tricarboxylate transporter receptor subunit TctC
MDIWFGVAVRSGTPPAAVAALNKEVNRIIALPEVKDRLGKLGLTINGGTTEAFAKTVAEDVAKWTAVARDAGIKPQ